MVVVVFGLFQIFLQNAKVVHCSGRAKKTIMKIHYDLL